MAERAIETHRRRARRALYAFFAVSVAAHAAVLVVLPPLTHGPVPARVTVLEVVALRPEPLPVVPPEAAPPPLPPRRTVSARAPAGAQPQPGRPAPVLALSEQHPAADRTFTAPAARPMETPAVLPEQDGHVAGVKATPPSYSAAYLRNPSPRYPMAARRAGDQGTVTLRVRVARDGLASGVEVEKSSGSPHLDAAALEAVKAWRFVPARQGADAIESWVLVPIVFRLEGAS